MGNRRTAKFFLVFIIILVWVFTGNPKLWPIGDKQNEDYRIPPEISEAEALTVAAGDGLIIYGVPGQSSTLWQIYTGATDSFGASSTIGVGSGGKMHALKTSPTKQEAIAVFATTSAKSATLQVACYDGTSWSNEWSTSTISTNNVRGFDVAYEASSGDVMVLLSTNASTTATELAYRTKSGTAGCGSANWSAYTTLNPVRTSEIIYWVKMASDRRTTSDLIATVWVDKNLDVSSMIWNGTTWSNEPGTALETNLERFSGINAYPDVDTFDLEYESGGDLMVVWGSAGGSDGVNGAYYTTCPGGTSSCTWSATSTIASLLDDAVNLDISANPSNDEIVFASVGSGNDLQAAYWSGSAWTGTANLDTDVNVQVAGAKMIATGWLISGATRRSVIVYNDSLSNNLDWYVGSGSSFTVQTDFTPSLTFDDYLRRADIQVDPIDKDNLIYTLSGSNTGLFSKRLTMDSTPTFTWTDSDGGKLAFNLSTVITAPFSFAYWTFISTVSCSTNISATALGGLDSGTISTSSPNASTTMTCNGASGCTLYVNDSGGGGNPGLWNSTSSALIESPNAAFNATATLVAGTEGYGIQGATTTVGSDGVLNIAARYLQTGNIVGGFLTSNTVLASSTAAVTNREVIVTHKAAVGAETPSGTYDDTITYNCVLN